MARTNRPTPADFAAALPLTYCQGAPRSDAGAGAATSVKGTEAASPASLAPREARAHPAAQPGTLILDVGSPDEWNVDPGHFAGGRGA